MISFIYMYHKKKNFKKKNDKYRQYYNKKYNKMKYGGGADKNDVFMEEMEQNINVDEKENKKMDTHVSDVKFDDSMD